MKSDDRDRLPELLLGLLPEDEARALAAEVAGSPELQREAAAVADTLAGPVAGSLLPIAPSPRARARLLDSLAGPERFQPFVAEIARRFDLAADTVRALLARIDDALAWEPAPMPWVQLIHFQGGPASGAVDNGFVRVAAGAVFPRHRHLGPEMTFVLEGTMIDGDRRYGPGEVVEWPVDTQHGYRAGPERDLVIMVGYNGIEPLE